MMEEKEAWQVWILNLPGLAWYWRRIEDGQGSNSSWMWECCDCGDWRPPHTCCNRRLWRRVWSGRGWRGPGPPGRAVSVGHSAIQYFNQISIIIIPLTDLSSLYEFCFRPNSVGNLKSVKGILGLSKTADCPQSSLEIIRVQVEKNIDISQWRH